ncbi:GNAT family N-acetyltransferase [Limimaricola sp.]|uniref:GNAT family N-acetyltransferase n=1 Tax=Limimaricola sp. TaxID=2211665 RepID=UPI0025BB423B|nr:GNAT family N-acetyltransferase [Limimaricola sp.]
MQFSPRPALPIERIAETDLTPNDETAIAALLARAFSADFGGRSFFQQRHHLRFVVREAGTVLGHAALTLRAVRLGDTLVDIAGLAEVATLPEARGRGIATALVGAAIAAARGGPARFVLLFGDRPLYAGLGFVAQPNPVRFVEMTGARTDSVVTSRDKGLMVLPLADETWNGATELDLMGQAF